MDAKRVGELIKGRRIELELTQEELGRKLGVTAQAVSKWEQGISLPDTALLPGICRVLSIPAAALLGIEESQEDDKGWTRYEQQVWQVRRLQGLNHAMLNLFAILVLVMYFILRTTSPVYFAVAVGAMALVVVAGIVSPRQRE